MKWMKRTLLSMIRKPAQMILMFLIVFVLGNVLFASIAVKQSSENVKNEMRSRIPTKIEINRDPKKYSWSEDISKMELFVEEIKNDEDVDGVDVVKEYKYVSGLSEEEFMEYPKATLVSFDELDDKLIDYTIVEGRNYTQEDLESDIPKVVISESLGYEVGDLFRIPIWDYTLKEDFFGKKVMDESNYVVDQYFEFEVIGTYDEIDFYEKNEVEATPVQEKWMDKIYEIAQNVIASHTDEEKEIYRYSNSGFRRQFDQEPFIRDVYIDVLGMDALERLETEIRKNPNYANVLYFLETSGTEYRYIQAPLENLVALANVAMLASAVLVIVLLSLVSILFMRNRKHEIGILMSLGERKLKVLGQFVCEILLVGLVASSCSMVSGNKLGSLISNEFIRIQIDTESEAEYQTENAGSMSQLDMLDAYKVEMTSEYILTIYGLSVLILLISSGLPVLYILRMKPKEVML